MSLDDYQIAAIWRSFMPHRKIIENCVTTDLISMKVYPEPLRLGDTSQLFEQWAAVEVTDFEKIPDGMQAFELSGGQYAVFDYKGLSSDYSIFRYIFADWLPNSGFLLDDRPHFVVLGEKYKNNDPDSEEEIWIPIVER